MVVIGEISGKDNGVVVSVKNPAIIQKPVRRIRKKIVYRNNIIEFNYLGWLSCKIGTFYKTNSKAFFTKSGPFCRTRSGNLSS